jgi:hypothetical protein
VPAQAARVLRALDDFLRRLVDCFTHNRKVNLRPVRLSLISGGMAGRSISRGIDVLCCGAWPGHALLVFEVSEFLTRLSGLSAFNCAHSD